MEDFNPLSPSQLKKYAAIKGWELPKDRKTKKPSTNEESLEKLLRTVGVGDRVLELALDARHLSKARGYLSGKYIGRDERFHPIYTFMPETGRLSAVRPNIQNQPNGGVDAELARAIRRCVVPSAPGRVLLEVDWKAMEAVLTGWFAGDPDYIAISKKDSHSYFCAYILRDRGLLSGEIPKPTDAGIDEFLSDIKHRFKGERAEAKAVNLATGYGMQWKHLSERLRCSAADAKRYLALKAEMAPKIEAWKEATWREAHSKGYLETPFGYVNYFWNVLEPIKGKPGKFRPGKEANEALAFRPQSTGAAMLREVMLDLREYDGELFDVLAPIHDALLVETDEDKKDDAFGVIAKSMSRSWSELSGLSIGVDAKWSKTSWADMEEVD